MTCPWKVRLLKLWAEQLQLVVSKSLETISDMILNQQQPKFASKREANAMFEKPLRDLHWLDKPQFSIQRFLSNLLLKIIISCVTDQPTINLFRRSVLHFKFSVLTFLRSMSCLVSIEQKMCEEKIFELQSMSNSTTPHDKRFAVKNSGTSCLALIFNLSHPRMMILQAKTDQGC